MYNSFTVLEAYNSYNGAHFVHNIITGRITPVEYRKGLINIWVSNSYSMSPVHREICKALISLM